MDLGKVVEDMEAGKPEAFKEAEDFFNGPEKKFSIANCVKHFYRFYAEKQMCKNLQLASQNLHEGNQTKANSYLEIAEVYGNKLSSASTQAA